MTRETQVSTRHGTVTIYILNDIRSVEVVPITKQQYSSHN